MTVIERDSHSDPTLSPSLMPERNSVDEQHYLSLAGRQNGQVRTECRVRIFSSHLSSPELYIQGYRNSRLYGAL
jgi:hypothetical protein